MRLLRGVIVRTADTSLAPVCKVRLIGRGIPEALEYVIVVKALPNFLLNSIISFDLFLNKVLIIKFLELSNDAPETTHS